MTENKKVQKKTKSSKKKIMLISLKLSTRINVFKNQWGINWSKPPNFEAPSTYWGFILFPRNVWDLLMDSCISPCNGSIWWKDIIELSRIKSSKLVGKFLVLIGITIFNCSTPSTPDSSYHLCKLVEIIPSA